MRISPKKFSLNHFYFCVLVSTLSFAILIGLTHSSNSSTSEAITFSKVIRRRVSAKGQDEVGLIDNPRVKRVLKRKHKDDPEGTAVSVTNGSASSDRNGRFFSLFTVVRFKNDPCVSGSLGNGTCYTNFECNHRGGVGSGTCASGFGVCCFFAYACGRSTSENGTYFSNPATPQRICTLEVNRISKNICQIRLEFELFEINGPNAQGICDTDFFLATGGSAVPQLCGTNTGQHVVYTITPNSGPTQLSMVMDTTITSTSARTFRIRLYQLECIHPYLAPNGCLQYYVGASGTIRSFNYRTAVTGDQPNHLANQNYAICFRIENGYCGIKYSQPTTEPFSFTLSLDASTITSTTIFPLPMANVKYGDVDCQRDYLIINSGSQTGIGATNMLFAKDRFCGLALGFCGVMTTGSTTCIAVSGPVTTYYRPFMVGVMTDADEGPIAAATDKQNRGFNLMYSQQPCLSG